MSGSDKGFLLIGFIWGIAVCAIALSLMIGPVNQKALDTCAKTHNVYQCEMVAVPKIGEK